MYRISSDNLGDSEMSPVARLFFSFPHPSESEWSEDWGKTMKHKGKCMWMTKWVLSYQSWTATKTCQLGATTQRGQASGAMCWPRRMPVAVLWCRWEGVEVCWLSLTFYSLSVWLTQVISTDLHFPCVWLKASCVKAVQIKTACHTKLSSTVLHGNSSPVSSALPLLPRMFICCQDRKISTLIVLHQG